MLKTRNAGQKRHLGSPGFDKNFEYRNWIASYGNVAGDLDIRDRTSHRGVTFNDETFKDSEVVITPVPIETVNVSVEWTAMTLPIHPLNTAKE